MILPIALLIGASLVLLGAGGSIVTLPALVYVAGLDVHEAAGTSLLVVGLVALAGAILKRRSVRVGTGLRFGLSGMIGAGFGAWLNHQVPETIVLGSFALTALLASVQMIRSPRTGRASRSTGLLSTLLFGAGTGVATGFFGVGGGFLIVPALTMLLGLEMRAAVATSLFVIALNSASGLAGHAHLGSVDWGTGMTFALTAMLGGALAYPFAERLSVTAIQRTFAVMLAVVGIAILAQTVGSI